MNYATTWCYLSVPLNREHEMTAVIGAHDLTNNDFDRIPVMHHHIHPDFKHTAPENDIMLLKVNNHSFFKESTVFGTNIWKLNATTTGTP